MIKPVSETNRFEAARQKFSEKMEAIKPDKNSSFAVRYADSFVRHSAESAPVLGALTIFWSFIDKSRFGSVKKALGYNAKNFFLPVLLITSAITALIENKKPRVNKEISEK